MIRFLLWLGLIARRNDGKIDWPIKIAPLWMWRNPKLMWQMHGAFYLFRNAPGVVKRTPGRVLPRRWGFSVMGLIEFGDRGH